VAEIIEPALKGQPASSFIVVGERGLGKVLEHAAAAAKRPVVYLPLSEATCPHHLFLAIENGVYSSDRLGFLGTLVNSMCIWWLVLFDVLVGREFYSSRAFHLSIVLQHLRRALCMAATGSRRPLLILDHTDDLACAMQSNAAKSGSTDVKSMRSMILHLTAWCTTVCYDDGTADVVICTGLDPARKSWKPWGSNTDVLRFEGARDLGATLRQVIQ